MASGCRERLGQQVIIENKPGGGTNIAMQSVVNSPPDGYTLLYDVCDQHDQSIALQVAAVRLPARHVAGRRALPNCRWCWSINTQVPAKNVAEFIAYAKANPGKVNIASFGARTISHLAIELLKTSDRHRIRPRALPGGAPMITDLISGRVQAGIDALPNSLPHIRSGAVRALAVLSRGADARAARRADHRPRSSRASRPPPGPASARRRARRPRSSSGSTARSTRALQDAALLKRFADVGGVPIRATPAEIGAR